MLVASRGLASAPVRLHFAEASTCGNEAELTKRLAARGVARADSGVALEVSASLRPDGAEASFELSGREGVARRTLSAESCEAVLDAVAFAVEVALANDHPEPPKVAPPPPPPAPPAPTPVAPPKAPPAKEPAAARWGAALGASGGAALGASPLVAARVSLHAEVEREMGPVLVPTLRLGAVFSLPQTTVRSGVEVAFASQAAFLSACPARFSFGAVALRPCARFEAGRLEAKADLAPGARLTSNVFLAAGLEVQGRVTIAGPVFLELTFDAVAPLRRSEFFVANSSAYIVSPVRFVLLAGAGVHFP